MVHIAHAASANCTATAIRRKAAEMVEGFSTKVIQIPSHHHPAARSTCNLQRVRPSKKKKWRPTFCYIPVLIEATTALLRQMLGPDIYQGTQTEWRLDITNGANGNHWWRLQNGHSLDDFLLVDLCKTKINFEVKHVVFRRPKIQDFA